MNIRKTKTLANKLLKQHNLKGWKIEFFKSIGKLKCCYGQCNCLKKIIQISTANTKETIKDTILHEIAHALVGRSENHNLVWQLEALKLGADANYTRNYVLTEMSKIASKKIIKRLKERGYKKKKMVKEVILKELDILLNEKSSCSEKTKINIGNFSKEKIKKTIIKYYKSAELESPEYIAFFESPLNALLFFNEVNNINRQDEQHNFNNDELRDLENKHSKEDVFKIDFSKYSKEEKDFMVLLLKEFFLKMDKNCMFPLTYITAYCKKPFETIFIDIDDKTKEIKSVYEIKENFISPVKIAKMVRKL